MRLISSTSENPLISVLMPLHNSAWMLQRAAQSILRQTVSDLELIIIDDGSSDNSYAVAQSLRDPRIRLYRNESNLGVAATRNRGLELARGAWVASMDSDDWCHRRRLEWTMKAMARNERVGLCGGWARVHGHSPVPYVLRYPCRPGAIRAAELFTNPFCYASILFRRKLIFQHELRFNPSLKLGEDYDFYSRLLNVTEGANIPRVMYNYRWNPGGLTVNAGRSHVDLRKEFCRPLLERVLNRLVSEDELVRHVEVGNGAGQPTEQSLRGVDAYLDTLSNANRKSHLFNADDFFEVAGMIWFRICRNSAHLGLKAWQIWKTSEWSNGYRPCPDEMTGFAASIIKARMLPGSSRPQGSLFR